MNSISPFICLDSIPQKLNLFQDVLTGCEATVYSFWITALALIFIYILRHACKVKADGEPFMRHLIEFFLDLCLSTIPLILVRTHEVNKDLFGSFGVVIAVIIISIGTLLRQKHSDLHVSEQHAKSTLVAIVSICMCLIFLCITYFYISAVWKQQ